MHEKELCASEDLFLMETDGDSHPALVLDMTDFGPLATGVCLMSVNQAMKMVHLHINEEPFGNPCAILCVMYGWESLHSTANRHLVARYQPQLCNPFYVGDHKVPKQEKIMLLQFGSEHIVIDDLSATAKVKGDIAEYVQISVPMS